jgi:hypothetical protein
MLTEQKELERGLVIGHRPDLEGRVDRCVLVAVRREPHIASARGSAAAGVLPRE